MVTSYIDITELQNNSSILKPAFHLNVGKIRFMNAVNKGIKFSSLKSRSTSVYTGGIFKRMFVENETHGLPYISAQHMMSFDPLEDAKSISKKYTPRQDDMTLFSGQILVSCAGTIGNVRLVTEDLNGIIGSQDIIRVISNEKDLSYKFLYAYLKAPTVYSYIQSFIYGSVVPRIEPKTFEKLPIPQFKSGLINYVEEKIGAAEKYRVGALNSLKKAHAYFDSILSKNQVAKTKIKIIEYNNSASFQSRIDASYNIRFREITELIKKSGHKSEPLKKFIEDAFIPNRGKRIYTRKGLRYLSSSEIFQSNPFLVEKYISIKTPKLSSMIVKKGWIIVARSGQEILGSVQIVGDSLNGIGVNEHGLRLITTDKDSNYIFAFLSSRIGRQYLRAGIFGSAILTIDDTYIKEMLLPIISTDEKDKVSRLVGNYIDQYDKAAQLEAEAIFKIEQEIESWQK